MVYVATTSPEEWELDLQLLQQQLSAENYPRNLGSTNFRNALTFAAQVFDEAPAPPSAKTLRGVVILTDGDPCVPNEFDCVRDDAAKLNHMRDVQQLVASQFPSPEYILYVLALDEGGRYWSQFEAAWVQVVGDASRAALIKSDVAIAGRFRQILDELIAQVAPEASANQGEQLAPGANTIIVDPYLRSIQFTLYKPSNTPSNRSP